MSTAKAARPRLKPAGQSGSRTLSLPTLVQDKERREELKQQDLKKFLEEGGMQAPTVDENDPQVQEQEFIRQLFTTPESDWENFTRL